LTAQKQRGIRAPLMQSVPTQRGEMSQDSGGPSLHPEVMHSGRRIDPAARTGRSAFNALSSASVGLELGLSVIIGLLMGYYLDKWLGTGPWLMLLFLGFGLASGFRGVLRSVRRAEKAAEVEARG
jgi:ATP synthase protein I